MWIPHDRVRKVKYELGRKLKKGDKEVINATEPLTILVKQCDNESGIRRSKNYCALGQSLRRNLGALVVNVRVGTRVTRIETGTQIIRQSTPYSIRRIIYKYDGKAIRYVPVGEYTFDPFHSTSRTGIRMPKRTKSKKTNRFETRLHSRWVTA